VYGLSRELIKNAERIVIKIGTKVLTENDNTLSYSVIESIVRQVSEYIDTRRKFIIVSSGAIALGLSRMGLSKRPKEINLLQAAASLGQSSLMHAYEVEFKKSTYETAQILLTSEDIQHRKRYLNIRNTIFALLSHGAIPVVNENDTVAYDEIRFGDNDLLAAHLAVMIDADLLIILTDTDGVYDRNPNINDAKILSEIPLITSDIKKLAQGKGSIFSSGGMESKLKAAEIATTHGVGVIITNGKKIKLKHVLDGEEIGSFCVPSKRRIRGKKKWIALNPKVDGRIYIDKGGERAIVGEKKSLLPVGVKAITGSFEVGGNVAILNEDNVEIARGLTNFSSQELHVIKGLNTKKIGEKLDADTYFDEVVHRDNMVILV
jgi:glutamate 5-kinase